jgi:hypothetical protein
MSFSREVFELALNERTKSRIAAAIAPGSAALSVITTKPDGSEAAVIASVTVPAAGLSIRG